MDYYRVQKMKIPLDEVKSSLKEGKAVLLQNLNSDVENNLGEISQSLGMEIHLYWQRKH